EFRRVLFRSILKICGSQQRIPVNGKQFPVLFLYRYLFRENKIVDFIVEWDEKLHMVIERPHFGAFLVALHLLTSSDTNIKTQKPGALTAVGNERFFFTEFHFQCLS